jgi:hypothetical protein
LSWSDRINELTKFRAVVIPLTCIVGKQNYPMRPLLGSLALACVVLLVSCATPESRIADNRSTFDSFPPEVQQKIKTGQVEVGFTPEMVLMSLGEPARKFTRKTELGDTDVWSYHDDTPKFSLGFGVGSGGRGSSMGGGVGVSSGGYDPDEKVRVEFRNEVVTAVDLLRKK